MKTTIRTTAAALGVAALLGGGIAAGSAFAATTTTASDSDVATALTFAREEERMARDLYAALAAEYDGARPFSNITRSEDRHFDAIGTLLDRYDVTDPSAGKAAGTYAVAAVQDLYDGWLEEGRTSLEAAYRVGVELEQRDIADLEKSIADDLPSDVDVVLGHLLEGSKNHLAAYQRAVEGDLGTGTGGRWGDTDATPNGTPRNGAPGMMNRHNGNSTGIGNGPGMGPRGIGSGPGTGDCPYLDTDD